MRLLIVVALASANSAVTKGNEALAEKLTSLHAILSKSSTPDEAAMLEQMAEQIKGVRAPPALVETATRAPRAIKSTSLPPRVQRAKAKLDYTIKQLLELKASLPAVLPDVVEASPDFAALQKRGEHVQASMMRYAHLQSNIMKLAKAATEAVQNSPKISDDERAVLLERLRFPHGDAGVTVVQGQQVDLQKEAIETQSTVNELENGYQAAGGMEQHLREGADAPSAKSMMQVTVDAAGSIVLGDATASAHKSPIPRLIWSANASPLTAEPWRQQNPDFKMMQMSVSDMDRFVQEQTDKRTYQAFRTVPLDSMKLDIWRYAVMFKYGGVYADASLKPVKPVREWFQPSSWMQGMGCKAVFGLGAANTGYVSHRAFAAAAGLTVFKQALDMVVDRMEEDGGVDEKKRGAHFADYYTGAALFTDALKSVMGVRASECPTDPDGHVEDGSGGRVLNSCLYNHASTELRRQSICLEDESFFTHDAVRTSATLDARSDGKLHPLWDGNERWDKIPKPTPHSASAGGSSGVSDMLDFVSDMDQIDSP